ncbi:MAG: hypothetical protein HY735_37085 [Verrucomicrobia bacterium]|nr:hypothetical protein [Verrucomicrobiota bacterium]
MKISKALKQCYDLQDLLFSAANDKACSKADLSRLACAWERLEERKRILRGRPLPGSLKPEKKPPGRRAPDGYDTELALRAWADADEETNGGA